MYVCCQSSSATSSTPRCGWSPIWSSWSAGAPGGHSWPPPTGRSGSSTSWPRRIWRAYTSLLHRKLGLYGWMGRKGKLSRAARPCWVIQWNCIRTFCPGDVRTYSRWTSCRMRSVWRGGTGWAVNRHKYCLLMRRKHQYPWISQLLIVTTYIFLFVLMEYIWNGFV